MCAAILLGRGKHVNLVAVSEGGVVLLVSLGPPQHQICIDLDSLDSETGQRLALFHRNGGFAGWVEGQGKVQDLEQFFELLGEARSASHVRHPEFDEGRVEDQCQERTHLCLEGDSVQRSLDFHSVLPLGTPDSNQLLSYRASPVKGEQSQPNCL